MAKLKYVVTVDDGQELTLVNALRNANIEFDQVNDMVAFPQENLLDGIFTGRDLHVLRNGVNEFLEREGMPYRMYEEPDSLPAVTRMALLNFFTLHAWWTKEYDPKLQEVQTAQLNELREQHPDAFVSV